MSERRVGVAEEDWQTEWREAIERSEKASGYDLGTSWILRDGQVVEVPYMEALIWRISNPSLFQIGRDECRWGLISTVFLGGMKGKVPGISDPALFETMIPDLPFRCFENKFLTYRTLRAAQWGHRRVVRKLRGMEARYPEE